MARLLKYSVDDFVRRLLQDCLSDASRAFWLRREQTFLNARPKRGEFHGNATTEQLRERWLILTEIAAACRARAETCGPDEFDADVDNVLREAS